MADVKKVLIESFLELESEDFINFRRRLCDINPEIRKAAVEGKDRYDVADIMKQTFPKNALQVAINVYRDVRGKCNAEAEKLEDIVKSTGAGIDLAGVNAGTGSAPVGKPYMVGGKHFVDVHQKALTQRVRLQSLQNILQELKNEDILNKEEYRVLKREESPQKIMRELYDETLDAAGNEAKDFFYEQLLEHEKFVMQDLLKKT